MKKFVFASVIALACMSLFSAPRLRAQDSDTISIKDPAEFNAFQNASTQSDPKAKAAALESFLQLYPQSVVKKTVLDMLIDSYQAGGDADKALTAATRLLQADPVNMKAVVMSVMIKKSQCGKTQDAQTCDDAAALARKGLSSPKPAATSDADWKKQTSGTYPIFHSALALDQIVSKKDVKAGIEEYRQELMLYPPEATTSGPGLVDTLQIAEAYVKLTPADSKDAIWFYARALNFAPDSYKPVIEKKLDYWYKKFHGAMDGLDELKAASAKTVFPAGDVVKAAATPAEKIHDLLSSTPADKWGGFALADKETVLAVGSKEDADKLWGLLKDQPTPVPGTVMEAQATGMKVIITHAAKAADFKVALKAPMACADIAAAGTTPAQLKEFILANGVAEDTAKIEELAADYAKPITKLAVEGTVSVIKMAVTDDAKDARTPDFIVNLKEPTPCKEVPAVGGKFGLQSKGDAELDGTYDTYRQIAATATTTQAAEIVLREGFIQAEKKKAAAPVAHKPAAGHKPAHK